MSGKRGACREQAENRLYRLDPKPDLDNANVGIYHTQHIFLCCLFTDMFRRTCPFSFSGFVHGCSPGRSCIAEQCSTHTCLFQTCMLYLCLQCSDTDDCYLMYAQNLKCTIKEKEQKSCLEPVLIKSEHLCRSCTTSLITSPSTTWQIFCSPVAAARSCRMSRRMSRTSPRSAAV